MNIRLIRGWEKVKDKGRGEEEIVVSNLAVDNSKKTKIFAWNFLFKLILYKKNFLMKWAFYSKSYN